MLILNVVPLCVTCNLLDAGGQLEVLNINYDIFNSMYKPCAEFTAAFSVFFSPFFTLSAPKQALTTRDELIMLLLQ